MSYFPYNNNPPPYNQGRVYNNNFVQQQSAYPPRPSAGYPYTTYTPVAPPPAVRADPYGYTSNPPRSDYQQRVISQPVPPQVGVINQPRVQPVAPQPAVPYVTPQPAVQYVTPQPAIQPVTPQPTVPYVTPQPAIQPVAPQPAIQSVTPQPPAPYFIPRPPAPHVTPQPAVPHMTPPPPINLPGPPPRGRIYTRPTPPPGPPQLDSHPQQLPTVPAPSLRPDTNQDHPRLQPSVPTPTPSKTSSQTSAPRKPDSAKKEFYDLEWKNNLIVRLASNEVIDHLFEVSESSFYGKEPAYVAVSNRRFILITEDLKGGVYWPLETTKAVRVETGKMFSNWSRFVFQSTVPNSTERYVQFEDKKEASVVETLFQANVVLKEYSTVYIKKRQNALAVFNEECTTVTRFSKALMTCSQNLNAMFIWLISAESYLPLVKQQLRAAANAWAKSTMGNNVMDDLQMLDVIEQGSDEEAYYHQLANQIARFLTTGPLLKSYRGAIPLLDAYYYYGRATANDLKSPEEFMKACRLLTKANARENHLYFTTIKGKEVLCLDEPLEESEEAILKMIDGNNGCIAKNTVIQKLGLSVAVCNDIISKIEKSGKIVRDSSSTDIMYYRNAFVLVKTKLITNCCVC